MVLYQLSSSFVDRGSGIFRLVDFQISGGVLGDSLEERLPFFRKFTEACISILILVVAFAIITSVFLNSHTTVSVYAFDRKFRFP